MILKAKVTAVRGFYNFKDSRQRIILTFEDAEYYNSSILIKAPKGKNFRVGQSFEVQLKENSNGTNKSNQD